jgi:hypothetical protein
MFRCFRSMMLALVVATLALCVPSAATAATGRAKLATRLVNRYLTDIEHRDLAGLRTFLSPAFQLQRADGSRQTKAQYLRNLPTVRSYRIRDLQATSTADALVATYEVAANEVINGKQLRMGYAPRISAFVRGRGGWRMIAHANFNTPS